jgi:ligand-binding SRPBCC domain-containing protein
MPTITAHRRRLAKTTREGIVPTFCSIQRFAFPIEAVFDFFRRPAGLVSIAPPELNLQLLEAPEVLSAHSRMVVQARRWGISQRIVTEVVELVDNSRIVEEQRQGPFRSWRHERHFVQDGASTEIREQITFEPPGGLLGLVLTVARIEADLRNGYAYREGRVHECLRERSRRQ